MSTSELRLPLKLMEQWREQGLSPGEIYQKCVEINKAARLSQREERMKNAASSHLLKNKNGLIKLPRQKNEEDIFKIDPRVIYTVDEIEALVEDGYKEQITKRRLLPPIEELLELLKTNSRAEVARMYGVTSAAITWQLKRVKKSKKNVTKKTSLRIEEKISRREIQRQRRNTRALEFLELYKTYTLKEIGEMFDISYQRVRQIIFEAGYSLEVKQ